MASAQCRSLLAQVTSALVVGTDCKLRSHPAVTLAYRHATEEQRNLPGAGTFRWTRMKDTKVAAAYCIQALLGEGGAGEKYIILMQLYTSLGGV